jgi:hypothetical protein
MLEHSPKEVVSVYFWIEQCELQDYNEAQFITIVEHAIGCFNSDFQHSPSDAVVDHQRYFVPPHPSTPKKTRKAIHTASPWPTKQKGSAFGYFEEGANDVKLAATDQKRNPEKSLKRIWSRRAETKKLLLRRITVARRRIRRGKSFRSHLYDSRWANLTNIETLFLAQIHSLGGICDEVYTCLLSGSKMTSHIIPLYQHITVLSLLQPLNCRTISVSS